MTFSEVCMDLFDVSDDYYLAHCVASDICMGAGIAVPMNARFGLRQALRDSGESLEHPTCVLVGRVFNLVTKAESWQKPTVPDFLASLRMMRDQCVDLGVERLAMPRLGCGLDGLRWPDVKRAIQADFFETDVDVLVCVWR